MSAIQNCLSGWTCGPQSNHLSFSAKEQIRISSSLYKGFVNQNILIRMNIIMTVTLISVLGVFFALASAQQTLPDSQLKLGGKVKINTDINSPDVEVVIMSSQQYHFITLGSFFQFSTNSWELGFDSNFLTKITLSYSVTVASPSPIFNFIVLNSRNGNASSIFNCYVRAVNEGVTQLMSKCQFAFNSNPEGHCGTSITEAAKQMFMDQSVFVNCTDTNWSFNISLEGGDNPLNETFLFLIDNSGLLANVTQPSELIGLILSYKVVALVNESDKARIFLFCGLTGILIIVLFIIAFVLNCKTRRLGKQIEEIKENKIS